MELRAIRKRCETQLHKTRAKRPCLSVIKGPSHSLDDNKIIDSGPSGSFKKRSTSVNRQSAFKELRSQKSTKNLVRNLVSASSSSSSVSNDIGLIPTNKKVPLDNRLQSIKPKKESKSQQPQKQQQQQQHCKVGATKPIRYGAAKRMHDAKDDSFLDELDSADLLAFDVDSSFDTLSDNLFQAACHAIANTSSTDVTIPFLEDHTHDDDDPIPLAAATPLALNVDEEDSNWDIWNDNLQLASVDVEAGPSTVALDDRKLPAATTMTTVGAGATTTTTANPTGQPLLEEPIATLAASAKRDDSDQDSNETKTGGKDDSSFCSIKGSVLFEVVPGEFVELHGPSKARQAQAKHRATVVKCNFCLSEFQVDASAEALFCTNCESITCLYPATATSTIATTASASATVVATAAAPPTSDPAQDDNEDIEKQEEELLVPRRHPLYQHEEQIVEWIRAQNYQEMETKTDDRASQSAPKRRRGRPKTDS